MELGSGVGLGGLLASRFASFIALSDREPSILEVDSISFCEILIWMKVLRQNAGLSSGNVAVCELEWGNESHEADLRSQNGDKRFDVILGCDVVYPGMPRSVIEALFHSVKSLGSEDSEFWCTYIPRRRETDLLLAQVQIQLVFICSGTSDVCF